jgi:hypothetical protein
MTPAATEMKRPIAHRYRHNRDTKLVVLPIGGKAAGIAGMKRTVLFGGDTGHKKLMIPYNESMSHFFANH